MEEILIKWHTYLRTQTWQRGGRRGNKNPQSFANTKLKGDPQRSARIACKIINNYWTRLNKISWLFVASRSIVCRSRRLRQIIDLRDTEKSWYFAITEFNNCFIIRSPSMFFQWISFGSEAICHFHARAMARRRKHGFLYAWAEYYLQPNTVGRHCTWADHYL